MLPGPHTYEIVKEMKEKAYLAKSMLGGSKDAKPLVGNGFPGPGAH